MQTRYIAGLVSLGLLLALAPGAHAGDSKYDFKEQIFDEDVIEAIKDDDYDDFKDELEDNTDDLIDSITEDNFEEVKDIYYRENWKKGYEQRKSDRAKKYEQMKHH